MIAEKDNIGFTLVFVSYLEQVNSVPSYKQNYQQAND